MKITINVSEKEVSLFKGLISKVKAQIVTPISNQFNALMGKKIEGESEPIRERIKEVYEDSFIITTENWNNGGVDASITIKTSFIEKVYNMVSGLIDESGPVVGAFTGAFMMFTSFIETATTKVSSFIEKLKEEDEEGAVYSNYIYYPGGLDGDILINALIRTNRYGYASHIGWICESASRHTFEEDLRLVEKIEKAIELKDYSELNSHFMVATFDNKEEAEKWFKSHNKVSSLTASIIHGKDWTAKNWQSKKEETEKEATPETETTIATEEINLDDPMIKTYKEIIDDMSSALEELKSDPNDDEVIERLRKLHKIANDHTLGMPEQLVKKFFAIHKEANSLIMDSDKWLC